MPCPAAPLPPAVRYVQIANRNKKRVRWESAAKIQPARAHAVAGAGARARGRGHGQLPVLHYPLLPDSSDEDEEVGARAAVLANVA